MNFKIRISSCTIMPTMIDTMTPLSRHLCTKLMLHSGKYYSALSRRRHSPFIYCMYYSSDIDTACPSGYPPTSVAIVYNAMVRIWLSLRTCHGLLRLRGVITQGGNSKR
uniref:Uncharacterized protein n=1 Tax=Zeugodacus cucurbitae TaxID=28588 RepID=A0A0A1XSL4_ZEUCU